MHVPVHAPQCTEAQISEKRSESRTIEVEHVPTRASALGRELAFPVWGEEKAKHMPSAHATSAHVGKIIYKIKRADTLSNIKDTWKRRAPRV